MTPRSWTVSLALHGLAVASFLALVPTGPAPKAPEPWLVSLVPAPAVPAVEPTTRPEPPLRKTVQAVVPSTRPQPMPSSIPSPPPVPKPVPKHEVKQAVHEASVPVQAPKPPLKVVEVQEPVVVPQAVLNPLPSPSPPAPDVPPTQVVQAQVQAQTQDPVPKVPTTMAPEPLRTAVRPQPALAVADRTAPPSVSANKEAQQRWYAALAAKLAQMKRYPLVARRMGQEGVVVLEARFRRDGEATASVKQSSGHASLDRAAVKLFEDAISALEGAVIPVGSGVLEIPVAYRLES